MKKNEEEEKMKKNEEEEWRRRKLWLFKKKEKETGKYLEWNKERMYKKKKKSIYRRRRRRRKKKKKKNEVKGKKYSDFNTPDLPLWHETRNQRFFTHHENYRKWDGPDIQDTAGEVGTRSCDVLLWTPSHGRAKAGRLARTYIQQLGEDTGCSLEDLPKEMNDRERRRERVRDICADGTTSWWWDDDDHTWSSTYS